MGAWGFDEDEGGKCDLHAHVRVVPDNPQGKLYCLVGTTSSSCQLMSVHLEAGGVAGVQDSDHGILTGSYLTTLPLVEVTGQRE